MLKTNLNIKKNLFFFSIFFLLSTNLFSAPQAKKGYIDLSNWNFDKDGITYLHGQWEFYWKQLLTPEDFKNKENLKPIYLDVPGLWNSKKTFPTFGYGTYRLLLKIKYNKELSIKLNSAATSYKLWINSKLKGENGKVAKTKANYIAMEKPAIYNIFPSSDSVRTIEIVIQVANFKHSKSGLWESIEIGSSKDVYSKQTKNDLWNSIVVGILLIMALYHWALYFLKRTELSTLYIGIFIFFIAIRNLVTNDELIYQIIPNLNFNALLRLQFLTAFPNVIFAGLFFYHLFKGFFNKKTINILIILDSVLAGIIIFAKISFFTAITPYFGIFLLLASTYFVIVLIGAVKYGEQGSVLALLGMLAMLIFGFADIISTVFTLAWPYLAPYGVVIFIILQTFIVTQRFTIALDENIDLNKNLYLQNKNLEKVIKSRTKEIQEKVELLQASEEELIQNNEELKALYENIDRQNITIKEKEQELENILNSIGEGVIITDFNENFLYANPTAHEIFEIKPGKLVGKNLKEFISDEEWTRIIIKTQRKSKKRANTYELNLNLPTGKTKNIIVSAVPHEQQGKPSASLAVFRDISNRVEKEKEIINLKNKLEILINNLPAHVYYKNNNLKYILSNNSYAQSIGLSAEEIIGKTDFEIFTSNKARELQKLDNIVLKENKAILNFEIKNTDYNGNETWWSISKVPFFNESGNINGIIGIVYDITEQKRNRELLIHKNRTLQKYFTSIEQSPITIIFTDFSGNIQYANPEFYNFTGFSPEETIGKNINFIKSQKTSDNTINEMWETIRHKKTWKGEFINLKKDKTEFIEKAIISPIIDENGYINSFVAIKEDITEFKRTQDIIKQKNEQFANTINNMLDIYVKCDFHGNFIDVSPSIVGEFKTSSLTEVLKTNIFDWLEITEKTKQLFFSRLRHNNNIKNFAFQYRRKDKVLQFAEINAVVFYIEGKPAGFEGIIRNVTERIEFENKLQKQKQEIEHAHKEIKSSIEYARHIQSSLLPRKQIINNFFNKNFLIFIPKDVVSGDFYYFRQINGSIVFAVGDCTGHGVAGGFLTMLSITILDEIVRKKQIISASEILNSLRTRIKGIYSDFGNQSHSGLDITLCITDKNKENLQYAGANNPLFLYRNNKLIEYKSTRNPIGNYINEIDFENNLIKLQKNDMLYLFSDGIQDQFGGQKQIKFTKERLKNLLLKVNKFEVEEQKKLIIKELSDWKRNNIQIDDITLLGIRID